MKAHTALEAASTKEGQIEARCADFDTVIELCKKKNEVYDGLLKQVAKQNAEQKIQISESRTLIEDMDELRKILQAQ